MRRRAGQEEARLINLPLPLPPTARLQAAASRVNKRTVCESVQTRTRTYPMLCAYFTLLMFVCHVHVFLMDVSTLAFV